MTQLQQHVDHALTEVDRQTELLLAVLRVVIVLILAFLLWMPGISERDPEIMVPLLGLALVTGGRFALAAAGLFRPWMAWLLATLDVLLLTHCLLMFADLANQPWHGALATPTALAIYLFLATAAVRYRPLLVLYTGGLFIAVWLVVWFLADRAVPGFRSASLGSAATDRDIVEAIARLAIVGLTTFALSIAIARARRTLIVSVTEARLRANLSRYFSSGVVDELARSGDAARTFKLQKAAVLFADIRGFTALAEAMPIADVAALLTEYRGHVAEAINHHGGTIDKFIGDGVMGVFGVPRPTSHDATDAAHAAVALLSAIDRWNASRASRKLVPIEVGIGVHYGDVLAGALGDDQRLEYTVIGDTVNTAQRLQSLTSTLRARLLVSVDVVNAAVGLSDTLDWESLPTRRLRGRRNPTQLYRLAEPRQMPAPGIKAAKGH